MLLCHIPDWCFCVCFRFEDIVERLNEEPDNTEGMDELEKFVALVESQLEEFDEKIAYAKSVYSALSKAQHLVEEDSDELFWGLCHWPVDLNVELDNVRGRLTKFRNR